MRVLNRIRDVFYRPKFGHPLAYLGTYSLKLTLIFFASLTAGTLGAKDLGLAAPQDCGALLLSGSEANVVKTYAHGPSVNRYLINKATDHDRFQLYSPTDAQKLEDNIRIIRDLIARSPKATEDIILYRGDFVAGGDPRLTADRFPWHPVLGASKSYDIALMYGQLDASSRAKLPGYVGVIMEITVKRGQPMFDFESSPIEGVDPSWEKEVWLGVSPTIFVHKRRWENGTLILSVTYEN
jgi:hypothetical protein